MEIKDEKKTKKAKKVKPITVKANKKGRHYMGWLNLYRILVLPFFYLLKPYKFYGNRKPPEGACVFVCNHYTMLDIAYALKEKKAKRIFAYATYAIFTNGLETFDKAYKEGMIDGVLGSNLTYRTEELKQRPWFFEVDVSKYIALIITAMNHDISFGNILDPHAKIQALLEEHHK